MALMWHDNECWKEIAEEAKRKMAAKKQGCFCTICKEFNHWAQNNHPKLGFLCFPCRTNPLLQSIYNFTEQECD